MASISTKNTQEAISQLRRICSVLNQCFDHDTAVHSRLIDELRELVASVATDISMTQALIQETEQSDFFTVLERQWSKEHIEVIDQTLFSYGQVYESFQLLKMIQEQAAGPSSVEQSGQVIVLHSKAHDILIAIQKKPAISNAELIERFSLTKGRISQIIKVLRSNELIVETMRGNHNIYAITAKGLRVLKYLEQQEGLENQQIGGALQTYEQPDHKPLSQSLVGVYKAISSQSELAEQYYYKSALLDKSFLGSIEQGQREDSAFLRDFGLALNVN